MTSATLIPESALPESIAWSGRPGPADLAPLPGCAAVFLFVDENGAPVQLLTTQMLNRVARSKLSEPVETRAGRTDLAEIVRGVRWRRVHSPFEARWRYYRLIHRLHPKTYRREIAFGPAWFLNVDWSTAIPELQVTERIWFTAGEFVGPWPAQRACRQALETLWDLFELCRFPEQVRKAPHGTPCAYAEMKRCDAPCDGSVAVSEYLKRVRAAWSFTTGDIDSWESNAQRRMKEAAAGLRFEEAGLLKQQLEAARHWRTQWAGRIRSAERLNYLLVIPATRRKAWTPFLFRQGCIIDGPLTPESKLMASLPTVAAELWEAVERMRGGQEEASAVDVNDEMRMEQTWLVAHFLHHREARAALVIPLSEKPCPADLAAWIEKVLHKTTEMDDAQSMKPQ